MLSVSNDGGLSDLATTDQRLFTSAAFQTLTADFTLPPERASLYFSMRNASQWNNLSGNCFFDDVTLTRISDPASIGDPATNLVVNAEADPDPNNTNFAAGWTDAYMQSVSGLLRPGYGGTATGFQIHSGDRPASPAQTIPASKLQPNTEYVQKAWMQGPPSECTLRAYDVIAAQLGGTRPRYWATWSEGPVSFTTGSAVGDVKVAANSSNRCAVDNIRLGPEAAASIASSGTYTIHPSETITAIDGVKIVSPSNWTADGSTSAAQIKVERVAETALTLPIPDEYKPLVSPIDRISVGSGESVISPDSDFRILIPIPAEQINLVMPIFREVWPSKPEFDSDIATNCHWGQDEGAKVSAQAVEFSRPVLSDSLYAAYRYKTPRAVDARPSEGVFVLPCYTNNPDTMNTPRGCAGKQNWIMNNTAPVTVSQSFDALLASVLATYPEASRADYPPGSTASASATVIWDDTRVRAGTCVEEKSCGYHPSIQCAVVLIPGGSPGSRLTT